MNRLISVLIICQFLAGCHAKIGEAQNSTPKESPRLEEFRKVDLFLSNPTKYFDKIKDISDLFRYIGIIESNSKDGFFGPFLKRHFRFATKTNARILVHLVLLNPQGELGYNLVGRVEKLFESSPRIFIHELKGRDDWKEFVETMRVGDWMPFLNGVEKLRDKGFEKEFKEFVSKNIRVRFKSVLEYY